MSRQNVISECAEKIMNIRIAHPLRVGVSGITASGKTTLVNEIARELQARGRKVIRTSIDQFHHPRHIRYRQGKNSAIGYYEDAHDYKEFIEKLLLPLGPGGNLEYHTISLDLEKDQYVDAKAKTASKDMIFIMDGTFLFKKELRQYFDYKLFVDADFEAARKRGAERVAEAFGNIKNAEDMFRSRYHAACELYIKEHAPKQYADLVIQNNDVANPYFC